jgi:hypothetical protein
MPNTLVEQKIAGASVSISDQWEVHETRLVAKGTSIKCICGKPIRKVTYYIQNRFNDEKVGPLGPECVNKMKSDSLRHHPFVEPTMSITTTPYVPPAPPPPTPAPTPPPAPAPAQCRVIHCKNTATTDKRYQFCTRCEPVCMRAGGNIVSMSNTRGTFDSFARTNPRAVVWMLEKHKQWKQNDRSSPYYHANNYRRAYAANELDFYHPDGYTNRDI